LEVKRTSAKQATKFEAEPALIVGQMVARNKQANDGFVIHHLRALSLT